MTHVTGHIDFPNRSFGVLYPVMLGSSGEFTLERGEPMLFVPGTKHYKKGDKVGFHPYLIPWTGRPRKFLAIAGDLIDWPVHLSSEEKIMKRIKKQSYLSEAKALEELSPYQLDDLSAADLKELDKETKQVLAMSRSYIQTPSFNILYKGRRSNNNIIKWLKENTVSLKDTGIGRPLFVEYLNGLK
jgi:hypothetical protein